MQMIGKTGPIRAFNVNIVWIKCDQNVKWHLCIQDYIDAHPETIVLDPLPAIRTLLDRCKSYQLVHRIESCMQGKTLGSGGTWWEFQNGDSFRPNHSTSVLYKVLGRYNYCQFWDKWVVEIPSLENYWFQQLSYWHNCTSSHYFTNRDMHICFTVSLCSVTQLLLSELSQYTTYHWCKSSKHS